MAECPRWGGSKDPPRTAQRGFGSFMPPTTQVCRKLNLAR